MRRKGDADMARIRERTEPFLRALFGDFFGRGLRSFIEIRIGRRVLVTMDDLRRFLKRDHLQAERDEN